MAVIVVPAAFGRFGVDVIFVVVVVVVVVFCDFVVIQKAEWYQKWFLHCKNLRRVRPKVEPILYQ